MNKLTTCPTNEACMSTSLFKDSNGELFEYHKEADTLVLHKHRFSAASQKPTRVYLSEWFNPMTKRKRYIGPVRLMRSALLKPADATSKRPGADGWVHKKLFVSDLEWKETTVAAEEAL